jgi:hypothetical protein
MTEDALEEWREHPVTIEAYWAGNPIPEAERVSIRRQMDLWSRIFQAGSAEFDEWKTETREDV